MLQAARFLQAKLLSADELWGPKDADRPIILFSRSRNRFIDNEQELASALEHKLGHRVVTVQMETHSFYEQVRLLSHAKLAVGMHGSLLIMSIFLPPGSALLELYPFAVPAENYTPYKTLASLRGAVGHYAVFAVLATQTIG